MDYNSKIITETFQNNGNLNFFIDRVFLINDLLEPISSFCAALQVIYIKTKGVVYKRGDIKSLCSSKQTKTF